MYIAAGSLAVSLAVFASPLTSYASDLNALRNKSQQLAQQQQQLQQTRQLQKSDLNSAQKQADMVNASVDDVKQQIKQLNKQIDKTNTQIKQKDQDIAVAEQQLNDSYSRFMQQQRTLYEAGSTSFLDVLLSSKNLPDFLNRLEVVQSVTKYQDKMINDIRTKSDKLKNEKDDLQTNKKSLSDSQGSLNAKQDILDTKLAEKSAVVSSKKQVLASTTQQLDAVAQQKAKTDAEIDAEIAAEAAARAQKDTSFVNGSYIVSYAANFLGYPYVFGTAGPRTFDCSGFVQYVYANAAGIALTHSSAAQASYGVAVSRSNLRPGDLVFFAAGRGGIDHVGIFVSGSRFINAPNAGSVVRYDDLNSSYWSSRFVCARRILK